MNDSIQNEVALLASEIRDMETELVNCEDRLRDRYSEINKRRDADIIRVYKESIDRKMKLIDLLVRTGGA